jgi:hypothetical protein
MEELFRGKEIIKSGQSSIKHPFQVNNYIILHILYTRGHCICMGSCTTNYNS